MERRVFDNRLHRRWWLGLLLVVVASCDGIYDDPAERWDSDDDAHTFSWVDATSYTDWVYIDLTTHTVTACPYDDSLAQPVSWHIALHRYDVRTNGMAAFETDYTSLATLQYNLQEGRFELPVEEAFEADVADSIIIDMSTMMDGYLTRAPSLRNSVLSRWLDVDMRSMPPIYTPSGRVYLLRTADGTTLSLLFTGFTNPRLHGAKGWISFVFDTVARAD
ncbi:MAG: HmuY family protein [Bacteroidales bacterium]|nr:HmuY family protein [Bacteroidales bacterium]